MTKAFKKAQNRFATIQNTREDRQDILVGSKEFWQACKWFFKQGSKQAKVVTNFPACYWQSIEDLTEEHGEVLGRCGNEFSIVNKVVYGDNGEFETVADTEESFDAKEFLVFPKSNRKEVEVTYSAKGLVLGITWEGVEGTYPLQAFNKVSTKENLVGCYELTLQGKHPNHKSLTGTGDFIKQLGAVLVITKQTTLMVNDKPFVNTEVSREFIGDLTEEQMEELDNEMDW